MKNVDMCYIRVTEGKIECFKKGRQNEYKHLNFHLHNTLILSESVHKRIIDGLGLVRLFFLIPRTLLLSF